MTKIIFFSQTGQTKKFVNKITEYQNIEISPSNFQIKMKEPFIFVMPTYEKSVYPDAINTAMNFLETSNNLSYCKGLFGSGNRNFAQLFCITARILSEKYKIPLLHKLEFQGSSLDVDKLKEELKKIE